MSSEVDPVSETDQQDVGDAGPTEKKTPVRDWFARQEATSWMSVLGAIAVIFGAVIAWRQEEAGTVLVIGAVLLGLGTIGKQIVGFRGKWKNFELGIEMARKDVEEADSLIEQRKEILESEPTDTSELRALEQKLDAKIDNIRDTLNLVASEAVRKPGRRAPGRRATAPDVDFDMSTLLNFMQDRLLESDYHAFYEKRGDGKVRLHLQRNDSAPFEAHSVRVVTEDGGRLLAVARVSAGRATESVVTFPDDFPSVHEVTPGRYAASWLVDPTHSLKRMPVAVAVVRFTFP